MTAATPWVAAAFAVLGATASQSPRNAVPAGAVEFRWARIPPGQFQMGCVPGDAACDRNERPQHPVTLTREFWVMATPVTVKAFRQSAAATAVPMPPQPDWSGDDHPVVSVNWHEAAKFCASIGGRLPTEAEWEYAARGRLDGALYPWGNDVKDHGVNMAGYTADGTQTVPVGKLKPNDFGLYDLVGNVWQWVADAYGERYYETSPSVDPLGPETGRFRVARGASWKPYPKLLRISNRGRYLPTSRNYYTGLRCARDSAPEL